MLVITKMILQLTTAFLLLQVPCLECGLVSTREEAPKTPKIRLKLAINGVRTEESVANNPGILTKNLFGQQELNEEFGNEEFGNEESSIFFNNSKFPQRNKTFSSNFSSDSQQVTKKNTKNDLLASSNKTLFQISSHSIRNLNSVNESQISLDQFHKRLKSDSQVAFSRVESVGANQKSSEFNLLSKDKIIVRCKNGAIIPGLCNNSKFSETQEIEIKTNETTDNFINKTIHQDLPSPEIIQRSTDNNLTIDGHKNEVFLHDLKSSKPPVSTVESKKNSLIDYPNETEVFDDQEKEYNSSKSVYKNQLIDEFNRFNPTNDFKPKSIDTLKINKWEPNSNNKSKENVRDHIEKISSDATSRIQSLSFRRISDRQKDREIWNVGRISKHNNILLHPSMTDNIVDKSKNENSRQIDRLILKGSERNRTLPIDDKINLESQFSSDETDTLINPQTKTVTTLPSVFDENLIPPLPQNWPRNQMEELWNKQSLSKYDEDELDKNDTIDEIEQQQLSSEEDVYTFDDANNETDPDQIVNEMSLPRSSSIIDDFTKVSFVKKPKEFINDSQNKYDFKVKELDLNGNNDLDLPPEEYLRKHFGTLNKTEPIPTVKITGKADTNEEGSSISYGREKISFITIPPGSYWHLWGSFSSRRRVDPFLQFNSNSNLTRDVTQVYTAYWGVAKEGNAEVTGIWILRFGSGVALITLIITIAAQTIKFCQPLLCQKAVLTTNLATSLAAAHVTFIFGIKAIDGDWVCGVVSLFLHFLYLLTCNWILAMSIRLLRSLLQKQPFHTAVYCVPVWIASLAVVVVSYGMNPSGYETQNFCWLSVERGMLFAFIGPVCTLLLVNAAICIACQKFILDVGAKSDPNDRSDLRAGVSLLPLHGVAWFLAVVALEDQQSLALDCVSAIATAAVGYFTLHFYVPSWQTFLQEQFHCISQSASKEKSLTLQLSRDNSQLPLLDIPPQPSTSNNSFTSTATSTTILLEEYQMQNVYLNNDRTEVY